VLGVLKKRGKPLVGPLIYGLAGFVLILAAIVGTRVLFTMPSSEQITGDNVDQYLREWLDGFGLAVQRQPKDQLSFFTFVVTLVDGNPVAIGRSTDRSGYLLFSGSIHVNGEHIPIITAFTNTQAQHLYEQVNLELTRARFGFRLIPQEYTPKTGRRLAGAQMMKSIPITPALTADAISGALDEIDSGMNLAREAIRLNIDSIRAATMRQ